MADAKITALCALGAAPDSADIIAIVDDPGGTPISKKLTIANLFTSPTLVTPALGTPASGVLTNATGLPEAGLVDNAVTLAKMAGGTDGNIISYDACGNPVAIATGTDGQVLTSTGAGSPPAFEAAGGGSSCGWDKVAVLGADQTKTCCACFTTITGFTFCALACSSYALNIQINYVSSATPDIKLHVVSPTNSTGRANGAILRGWNVTEGTCVDFLSDINPTTTGCCASSDLTWRAIIQTGACAGAVALQFSQGVSDSQGTTIKGGSFMAWKKG